MNSGVNVNDPVVIAAFKSALLHQGLIALLIFGLLGLAWITVRAWWPAAAQGNGQTGPAVRRPSRCLSRPGAGAAVGFGLLGSSTGSCRHSRRCDRFRRRSSSPGGVAALAAGGELGRDHLVLSPDAGRGRSGVDPGRHRHLDAGRAARRLVPAGGPGRCGWGLVVWVFGESFGGVFAPGLTWLFGAPGAVLIYVVAGALIVLPERLWHDPRLGQAILASTRPVPDCHGSAASLAGTGLLAGISHGQPGTLAT
jgi:hypothetical protein